MTYRVAQLVLIGALFAACDGAPIVVGQRSSAIVNGAETSLHPAVGALLSGGSAGCTATLVGPRTVLTAAHCVEANGSVVFYPHQFSGTGYTAEHVTVHPDYAGGNKSDLAVVRLTEEVAGVTPLPIAAQAPVVGQHVELYGFGKTGEDLGEFGTKRRTINTIAEVSGQIFSVFGAESDKGNVCDGDSGGPTLTLENGRTVVVGVHSTKGGVCGQAGHDMRVDVFRGWIAHAAEGDLATAVPADGAGPSVSFLKPLDRAAVASTFSVLLDAADDVTILDVELYVDGKLRSTAEGAPYRFDVRNLTTGAHVLEAVARDGAGHSTTARIEVTVTRSTATPGDDGRSSQFDTCETDADCGGGICALDAATEQRFCTRACDVQADDCPGTSSCVSTGTIAVCAPDLALDGGEPRGCSVGGSGGASGAALVLLALLLVARRRLRA